VKTRKKVAGGKKNESTLFQATGGGQKKKGKNSTAEQRKKLTGIEARLGVKNQEIPEEYKGNQRGKERGIKTRNRRQHKKEEGGGPQNYIPVPV